MARASFPDQRSRVQQIIFPQGFTPEPFSVII